MRAIASFSLLWASMVVMSWTPDAKHAVGASPKARAAATIAKKWHPGHYAQLHFGASDGLILKVAALPEMMGCMLQYDWRDLEKSKDVYDFTKIEHDLALLQSRGKRLVILVNDKLFKSRFAVKGHAVPDYLLADPNCMGGEHVIDNSAIAKRWVPAVMERIIALHRALGRRFDSEPFVEGVCTEESALGNPSPPGMTSRNYVEQLKRLGSAMAEAYPHTLGTIWLNWKIKPYTQELVDHLCRLGIGIGGPDTSPQHLTEVVPEFTTKYAGKLPILMAVQPTWLCWSKHPIRDKELTLDQVFHFLVDEPVGIHATHAFWWYFDKGDYTFADTVQLIRKYNGKINQDVPLSLRESATAKRPRR